MSVAPPVVGNTVLYFAGAADRRGGFVANAAIVLAVGKATAPDYDLTVLVFAIDGTPFVRSSVIHKNSWAAAGAPDAVGCWAWPPAVHL